MQNRGHQQASAVRQERRLTQAGFTSEQTDALTDVLSKLLTRDEFLEFRHGEFAQFRHGEFAEFRQETRDRLTRLEARFDGMATKDDLNRMFIRLLVAMPVFSIIIVGTMLSVPYIQRLLS